ncbi:Hypothetical_protein [Hexamita inflata]|uniref:Hypothetical_protein n=1 Tax=Hexamita inflata TaxID=28002 RepID=A0AA86UYX7_9EUKA|nr:Hypothetical protein HINF_LOCUS57586 [Hexamita inflata]
MKFIITIPFILVGIIVIINQRNIIIKQKSQNDELQNQIKEMKQMLETIQQSQYTANASPTDIEEITPIEDLAQEQKPSGVSLKVKSLGLKINDSKVQKIVDSDLVGQLQRKLKQYEEREAQRKIRLQKRHEILLQSTNEIQNASEKYKALMDKLQQQNIK